MQPRYVVRPPAIKTTPKALAERFNCTTRNGRNREVFSFTKDFLLYYPPASRMEDVNADDYNVFRRFTTATKPIQRELLRLFGLRTPETYTTSTVTEPTTTRTASDQLGGPEPHSSNFIVRPLRHSSGQRYRITTERNDFIEGEEYISRVFPKSFEYRIITCFGEVISTLLKVPPPGATPEQAWNHHQGSVFKTVNNPLNNRLRHTTVYEDCLRFPIIKAAHLCGIDVLLAKDPWRYVICELNFCPSLTIENNLNKVVNYVNSR
jgi:hypothetical protein